MGDGPQKAARSERAPRVDAPMNAAELLAQALPEGGSALADVVRAWPRAVGPHLAARAWPERLVGTTLTLAVRGVEPRRLEGVADVLLRRLQAALPGRRVTALRFASAPAATPPARARPAAALTEEMAAALSGVEDPVVRAAIEAALRCRRPP